MPNRFTAEGRDTIKAQELADALQANVPIDISHPVRIEDDLTVSPSAYPHLFKIRNATFTGHVNFSEAYFARSVDLSSCTFEQNVNFSGARIDGSLWLSSATIHDGSQSGEAANLVLLTVKGQLVVEGLQTDVALDLNHAQITGPLRGSSLSQRATICRGNFSLSGARLSGGAVFERAEIHGNVDLNNTEVIGNLVCSELQVGIADTLQEQPGAPKKPLGESRSQVSLIRIKVSGLVDCNGVHIAGDLNLLSADIQGGLYLGPRGGRRAEVGGDLALHAARVAGLADLDGIRVGGDLGLDGAALTGKLTCTVVSLSVPGQDEPQQCRPEITGTVSLSNAEISRQVDFEGIQIGKSLIMMRTVIKGDFICSLAEVGGSRPAEQAAAAPAQSESSGLAYLMGMKVSGPVNFNGVWIAGDLNLQSADLQGGLYLCTENGRRTEVVGRVNLNAARVACEASLDGIRVGRDLDVDAAVVAGKLSCSTAYVSSSAQGERKWQGAEVAGSVSLSNAEISRQVDFEGIQIGKSLMMMRTVIKGNLLSGAFDSECRTDIGEEANLAGLHSGQVTLDGARIGKDLVLSEVVIKGSLFCRAKEGQRTKVEGQVWMRAAQVSRDVDFSGLDIVSGKVDFSGKDITSDLLLQGTSIQGVLSFGTAPADSLKVVKKVDLQGCKTREAELEFLPAKFPVNLEGFRFERLTVPGDDFGLFLDNSQPFSKGNYVVVEKWLRDQGKTDEADQVHLSMLQRNRAEMRKRGRMSWHTALGDWLLSIGYRVRIPYFLYPFFLLLLLSCWLFTNVQAVSPKVLTPGEPWGAWDGFWLAAQTHLPLIPFTASEKWKPTVLSSNPITLFGRSLGLSYSSYGTLVSLFGYVVLPLLLARIAVVLKREK